MDKEGEGDGEGEGEGEGEDDFQQLTHMTMKAGKSKFCRGAQQAKDPVLQCKLKVSLLDNSFLWRSVFCPIQTFK